LRLAQLTGGEIVNADALQLYADLRVLSARPSSVEEAQAPHHLFGVADAADGWSVGRWLRATTLILEEIAERGRSAIIVGGTGLYFAALTRGLAEIPPIPPEARQQAEALLEELGEDEFRRRASQFDDNVWRISKGDRQRLVRLYEVMLATGGPLSAYRDMTAPALRPGTWSGVVLEPPRPDLYARCDARFLAMIEAGALDEVAALKARALPSTLPVMKAVGVRELADYLDGRGSLAEVTEVAQRQTRRFAKRQMTWFRNQNPNWSRITALNAEDQWGQFLALNGDLTAPDAHGM
jgi:tRNA dimethylallyltransferase